MPLLWVGSTTTVALLAFLGEKHQSAQRRAHHPNRASTRTPAPLASPVRSLCHEQRASVPQLDKDSTLPQPFDESVAVVTTMNGEDRLR